MKKLGISLLTLCLTLGMLFIYQQPMMSVYGAEPEEIVKIQQMIDELPDIQDITKDNKAEVILMLDSIDEAKLALSDEEKDQLDFTKYDAAALALSAPPGWVLFAVVKKYTVPDEVNTPNPSFSFIDGNGANATMWLDANGTATCTSLDVEANGDTVYAYIKAGTYTVIEEVEGNWTMSLTVNDEKTNGTQVEFADGTNYNVMVVNTTTPTTINVTASVDWDDDNNRDGLRPASLSLVLSRNSEDDEPIYITESDNWSHTWENLPIYDDNRAEIMYNVYISDDINEYTNTLDGDTYTGYTFTLTHEPERANITVYADTNSEENDYPEKITGTLLKNNDETVVSFELNEENGWSIPFSLYKYENGCEILYSIQVDEIGGYNISIDGYMIKLTKKSTNGNGNGDGVNGGNDDKPNNGSDGNINDGSSNDSQYNSSDAPSTADGTEIYGCMASALLFGLLTLVIYAKKKKEELA